MFFSSELFRVLLGRLVPQEVKVCLACSVEKVSWVYSSVANLVKKLYSVCIIRLSQNFLVNQWSINSQSISQSVDLSLFVIFNVYDVAQVLDAKRRINR